MARGWCIAAAVGLLAVTQPLLSPSFAAASSASGSPPGASASPTVSAPPSFGSDSTYCNLADDRIDESSGLAVSTWDPTRLWTHNDSGDTARLFALDPPHDGRCATAGIAQLKDTDAFDAEDLASGPNHTLWLADIGDNIGQRKRIVVDRVTEPRQISGQVSVDAQRFRYTYPDEAHDAEALLISPRNGQLVIVTKGSSSHPRVYAAPGHPAAGTGPAPAEPQRLISEGDLNAPGSGGFFQAITGGAVSPDGRVVVLRTYLDAYIYSVSGDDLVAALRTTPRHINLPSQPQGESVTFTADGQSLLLSSEGIDTQVLKLRRESGDDSGVARLVGGDRNLRPLLIAGGAALVLGVLVLLFRRRRSG